MAMTIAVLQELKTRLCLCAFTYDILIPHSYVAGNTV